MISLFAMLLVGAFTMVAAVLLIARADEQEQPGAAAVAREHDAQAGAPVAGTCTFAVARCDEGAATAGEFGSPLETTGVRSRARLGASRGSRAAA